MNIRHVGLAVAAIALLGTAAKAEAGTLDWDFSYVANGVTASGVLTTSSVIDSSVTFDSASGLSVTNGGTYVGGNFIPDTAGYDILSVTGTRAGTGITGIYNTSAAGTLETMPGYIFDNVLYGASGNPNLPSFDVLGLEYQAGGNFYNVYFSADNGTGQPGYVENTTPITSLHLSAVPLPGGLPMFAGGLAAMAGIGFWRRGSRKVA